NGSGNSDCNSIPDKWSDSDYNWKIELPGVGHSSPVVWGNTVFVTSADPETGTRIALGVSALNGEILWRRDFPATVHPVHSNNSYASSTPAVDAGQVYVTWATPDEFALLALTHAGSDVWRLNLGPHESHHGFASSPIVVDDKVVIAHDH